MQKGVIVALLALSVLLPFQNCGMRFVSLSGTETGNAMSPPTNPQGPRAIMASVLVGRICDAQIACDASINKDSCVSKLAEAEGLAQEFGIDPTTGITTMKELATAEEQGRYAPSPGQSTACESEISTMNCSLAAPMASATSSSDVGGAAGTAVSNSPSCGTVY
jgi:hypothetical protein